MPARPDIPADFERMLDEMIAFPERQKKISARIHAEYGRRMAVLVLDMCGFTQTTQTHGIVAFLLMIHRMRRVCDRVFPGYEGEFVEANADNLLYLFPTPGEAIAACRAVHACLREMNEILPDDERLDCAIGIGWGDILCIAPGHIHGNEVNLAGKLGEDVAKSGQILITDAARADVPGEVRTREGSARIACVEIRYHEVMD